MPRKFSYVFFSHLWTSSRDRRETSSMAKNQSFRGKFTYNVCLRIWPFMTPSSRQPHAIFGVLVYAWKMSIANTSLCLMICLLRFYISSDGWGGDQTRHLSHLPGEHCTTNLHPGPKKDLNRWASTILNEFETVLTHLSTMSKNNYTILEFSCERVRKNCRPQFNIRLCERERGTYSGWCAWERVRERTVDHTTTLDFAWEWERHVQRMASWSLSLSSGVMSRVKTRRSITSCRTSRSRP